MVRLPAAALVLVLVALGATGCIAPVAVAHTPNTAFIAKTPRAEAKRLLRQQLDVANANLGGPLAAVTVDDSEFGYKARDRSMRWAYADLRPEMFTIGGMYFVRLRDRGLGMNDPDWLYYHAEAPAHELVDVLAVMKTAPPEPPAAPREPATQAHATPAPAPSPAPAAPPPARPAPSIDGPAGDTYVLLVGVNAYKDPKIPALRFAEQDARAMCGFYSTESRSPTRGDRVAILLGAEATRTRVLKTIREHLVMKANRPEDTVVLFFAGHGFAGAAGTYLATADTMLDELPETAISDATLREYWAQIQARRKVLIADACHSGGLEGIRGVGGVALAPSAQPSGAGGATLTIAATGANELSTEDPRLGQGVFTLGLLRGLRGEADANRDGGVSGAELGAFLVQAVPALAAAAGGRQTPMIDGSQGGLSIWLTRAAGLASSSAPLSPEPAVSAAREPTAGEAVGAIESLNERWDLAIVRLAPGASAAIGERLQVYRGGRPIGEVEVVKVLASEPGAASGSVSASAKNIGSRGFRPGDEVRR